MKLIMENWRGYQEEVYLTELERGIYNDLLNIEAIVESLGSSKGLILEAEDASALQSSLEGLWDKTKNIMGAAKNAAGKVIQKILLSLVSVMEKLLSKLPGAKQRLVRGMVSDSIDKFNGAFADDFGEGSQWNKKIEKIIKAEFDAMREEGILPNPEGDPQEIEQAFAKSASVVAKRIRGVLLNSPELKAVKSMVKARSEEILGALENEVEKSFGQKLGGFAAGASFMVGFGAVDNYGLWAGVEAIEGYVALNYPTMTISEVGMVGNTFSDLLGVVLGTVLAALIFKLTGAKGEGTAVQAAVGVTVGCLVPLFNSILFRLIAAGAIFEQVTTEQTFRRDTK
mgnify:CR=1 FL=1